MIEIAINSAPIVLGFFAGLKLLEMANNSGPDSAGSKDDKVKRNAQSLADAWAKSGVRSVRWGPPGLGLPILI